MAAAPRGASAAPAARTSSAAQPPTRARKARAAAEKRVEAWMDSDDIRQGARRARRRAGQKALCCAAGPGLSLLPTD